MKLLAKLFSLTAVLTLVFGLAACGEKASEPSPMEEAADAVEETSLDEMMDDAEDAAKDMMDEAEEMAEDAGDAIEEMADDAGDAIEDAADDAEAKMNELMNN